MKIRIAKNVLILASALWVGAIFLAASSNAGRACTSFGVCNGTNIAVGNNDDWFSVSAYLVVNQRGITKKAFLSSTNGTLEWTSKYGSVGVDYNAIGIPSAGMNEMGLVVDELAPGVKHTQYEPEDARPVIDEIQWIQYQLDNCATVDEVLATHGKIRIVPFYWHSHYFIYDRQGEAASIRFTDGEIVVTKMPRTGVQVLANRAYETDLSQSQASPAGELVRKANGGMSSKARFHTAAVMAQAFRDGTNTLSAVDYAFNVLTNVSQLKFIPQTNSPVFRPMTAGEASSTNFSVPMKILPVTAISWVYDPVNLVIHYRTWADGRTREARLSKLDFNQKSAMTLVDVNIPKSGDISGDFQPYTLEISRKLVTKSISDWRANNFAMHITDADMERLIQYPETLKVASASKLLEPAKSP